MQDDRAGQALGRIDAAIRRIEAGLAARPAPRPDTGAEELERLRAAHGRLRGRVEEAMTAIDRMLEDR